MGARALLASRGRPSIRMFRLCVSMVGRYCLETTPREHSRIELQQQNHHRVSYWRGTSGESCWSLHGQSHRRVALLLLLAACFERDDAEALLPRRAPPLKTKGAALVVGGSKPPPSSSAAAASSPSGSGAESQDEGGSGADGSEMQERTLKVGASRGAFFWRARVCVCVCGACVCVRRVCVCGACVCVARLEEGRVSRVASLNEPPHPLSFMNQRGGGVEPREETSSADDGFPIGVERSRALAQRRC